MIKKQFQAPPQLMMQNRTDSISTLLVTCWFRNRENPQHGTFVLDHAKSLLKSNLEVRILYIHIHQGTTFLQITEQTNEVEGIPVMTLELSSKFWKFLYQWPLLLRKKVLQFSERKFIADADIIHSHALFPAGFFGWQLAEKLQKPFVLTEHWSRAGAFLKKHLLGNYGKKIYKKAGAVIFVSENLKDEINRIVKPGNFFVIPNPIDGTLFKFKVKPDSPPIRFILIALWNMNSVKRGDLILEAFREIKNEIDIPFQIDFVGTGSALEKYKQMAQEYELPAHFFGYEDRKKLSSHLQESHFFLHPTEGETFGIVVFEALKTGTPVLVSNLERFKPYINSRNGMLVINNVKTWQEAILSALGKQYNYEKIAKEYEGPFSEQEVALKTREVYEKAIESKKKYNFKNH